MRLSDDYLEKLANKSGLSKEVITNKTNEKFNKLSGLVTKEGALYIVAKELGVEMESEISQSKIMDIKEDSRKINFVGRIFKISSITEFTKSNGSKGKVVNIYLSDGTGYVKLPLWDDQVSPVEDGLILLGSTIQVSNATAKENSFGELEIVLGKFGNLKIVDGSYNIPNHEELLERFFMTTSQKSYINDLKPGSAEIAGIITQVFKSKFVFNGDDGENFIVITCVIDDGTGNIRIVFFRDLAENLIGLTTGNLENLDMDGRYKVISKNLLGKEILVHGRVSKNMNFDRLEMVASKITNLNVLEESKKLVDSIETAIGV